jgi:hypothetical protein
VPVDNASPTEPFQYGSWVFWRYLEERLAQTSTKIDPGVIRALWELDDGSPGGQDLYSIQAVHELFARRGIDFADGFLTFAIWNFLPSRYYREGKTWPSAPVARTATLAPHGTTRGAYALDHLSSRYVAFVPGKGAGARAKLAVSVDLPSVANGSSAAVIVQRRSGAPLVQTLRLSLAGDATVTLPFGRGAVRRVVLVLTNASDRFQCGLPLTVFSCRGRPLDDARPYAYSARVR